MNTRPIFTNLLLFGSIMLTTGCTQQLYPVSATGVVEHTPAVTQEKDGIKLTVQTQTWDFYPRDLARFFTPIHIAIRNELDRPIIATLHSFILRDENGIAHYPIAPDKLVRVFYRVGDQPRPRRRPVLPQGSALPGRSQPATFSRTGWSRNLVQPAVYRGEPLHVEQVYHYGYYSLCYRPPPLDYAPQSQELRNTPLMLFAFREGVIPPQAHQGGYIFFQKATEIGQRFILHVHVQDAAYPHQGKPIESSVEFRVAFTLR